MASDFLFTCQTCELAFSEAGVQRRHWNQDHHRYNAKRRVAGLPPVSAAVFEAKVLSKREEVAPASEKRKCEACSKTFMSENAFANHLHSKKHKEAVAQPPRTRTETESARMGDEDAIKAWLDEATKIPRLMCLFCTRTWSTFDEKMEHMRMQHGFFVPDQEYLVDIEGLVERAAEEVGVFNACLYCGTAFAGHAADDAKRAQRALEAVRKHMNDKGHCKLLWDTDEQRLEWSDYYDYSASYADEEPLDQEGWEDTDEMVLDEEASEAIEVDQTGALLSLPPTKPVLQYGDTEYELILPSGARIGHKALRHIYRQNLVPYGSSDTRENKAARKLAGIEGRRNGDSAALIQVRGGDLIRARSSGDAKQAQKATKQFLGIKAREAHKTRVAIRVGNQQKHFRDELLQ